MKLAEISEARSQLPELIQRALEGEEVLIAKDGMPVVRLVPCERETSGLRPPPGLWKGQVWMADDFDETPQEIIDLFEGSEEDANS